MVWSVRASWKRGHRNQRGVGMKRERESIK
jgi:hypothetical protein